VGERGFVGVDDREARRAQDRHLVLGEIGEVAGADQRFLAPRDIGRALGPDPGDLFWIDPASSALAAPPARSMPWNRSQATRQS